VVVQVKKTASFSRTYAVLKCVVPENIHILNPARKDFVLNLSHLKKVPMN